jgi:hypothetical protein
MILRPVDDTGDILPVLSSSVLLSSARAVARLAEDRLNLYSGDWWENPAWGNRIIEMLRESRLTEADAQAMATSLTSYIRKTDGVEDVREVRFSVEGRRFSYACTVLTENGPADVRYVL